MCGVNLPEGSASDSENHLDSWLKADVKGRSWAVEQNLHNNLSITDGVWKYIPAANGPAVNKQTNTELGNNPKADQLYNLLSDPGEHSNVVWGIERSGFFNGREKWAKGFENQRV